MDGGFPSRLGKGGESLARGSKEILGDDSFNSAIGEGKNRGSQALEENVGFPKKTVKEHNP